MLSLILIFLSPLMTNSPTKKLHQAPPLYDDSGKESYLGSAITASGQKLKDDGTLDDDYGIDNSTNTLGWLRQLAVDDFGMPESQWNELLDDTINVDCPVRVKRVC